MSSGVRHSLSKEGTFVVSRKDASMFLQRKEGDRNSRKYHEGEHAQPLQGNRCDWHSGSISG